MPRNPQGRATDDDAQPDRLSEVFPEEAVEPGRKQDAVDADWLSMATADPALSLKDPGAE
jgi:hypothetical protein